MYSPSLKKGRLLDERLTFGVYVEHGTQEEQLEKFGLLPEQIVKLL